jgi:hypothetical protein
VLRLRRAPCSHTSAGSAAPTFAVCALAGLAVLFNLQLFLRAYCLRRPSLCAVTDNVTSLCYLPEHIQLAHSMYSDTPPRSDDPAITRALNDYIQREQLAINSTHAPFTRIPLRLPRLSSLDSSHHSILKDVSTKVTRTCVFCELNGDDAVKAADEEVDYSEGHFDCGSCLTKLTENLLKVENQAMLTYNACGAGQVLQVSS